jgi:hypothetical protein
VVALKKSLKLGDSLRRAIDKGLTRSRSGVVVLSKAFLLARNWPQYELDALAEREMAGNDKVLLPVWHGVTSGRIDLLARTGWPGGFQFEVLRKSCRDNLGYPPTSALIVARISLLKWGVTPPVITDRILARCR